MPRDCNFGIFQQREWKLVLDDVHRAFSELQYDPHAIEPPFVNKAGLYFENSIKLFPHTLSRLGQTDSAYEDDPNVKLKF